MRCTVCGTPLPAGARQCPRCGTFVAAPPASGAYVPPTVAVPPVNQGAPQSPPGAYQDGEPLTPTAYAPPRQSSPSMPGAYPNNPPGGMAGNQNMYNQGVPPLPPQSVPPLPSQYRHSNGDDGSGKKGSRALIIGLIALVVILLVGVIPVLLTRNSSNTSQNGNTTGNTGSTGTAQNSSVAATATALASGPKLPPNEKNPYAPSGTLILKDPMKDNSQGYMWQEGTANGTTCRFSGSQYHVMKASGSALCIPQSPVVAVQNVTVEADLNLQSGTYMGMATRIDPQKGTGYLFVIGTDGTYAINRVNIKASGSGQVQRISQGFSPALPIGSNQVKMGVTVQGTQLILFVNNQQIINVQDSRLNNTGGVGLFVNGNSSLNLAVSNVRVWKL